MLQLGLYKHLVTIIDRPNTSSPYFKSDKSQNDKIKQFMNSVQDNNEVLKRLTLIGYFDQTTDLSNVEGLNTYKSVLISSALTSIAMSTVLTPIDMIVFNQLQTRLYSVQQSAGLKTISFR